MQLARVRRPASRRAGTGRRRRRPASAPPRCSSTSVQPFAMPIIDEHHAAGRVVVLATTTPYDLVKPLADALGLDDVVATRYGVRDGRYDGTIHGEFVWGKGKLNAVQEWADEHDVSLADSYAYSDSWFDAPLLSAVGHPFAVNPDPRLMVRAALQRWPIIHLDVPSGVPKVLGIEPQQVVMAAARPALIPYARFDIKGMENIPETGAAIVVGNHRSYFDPMAMGLALAQRGRPVRFLGKKEVFDVPVVGQMVEGVRRHPRRPGHRIGRAVARGGRRAARRSGRRAHAAGHDPARRGVLRSEAEGTMGRGPARAHDAARRSSPSACGGPSGCGRAARGCRTC